MNGQSLPNKYLKDARVFLILAMVVCCLAIGSSSLETDEAYTASFALKSSLSGFLQLYKNTYSSEKQMPVFISATWLYAKIMGTSEWALRSMNILWGWLAVYSFYRMGRLLGIVWLPLLLAVHPFFWYYLDQARPYAMQIACSSWLLWLLLHAAIQNRFFSTSELVSFLFFGFVLSGSSLIAAIAFVFFAMIAMSLLWSYPRKLRYADWAGLLIGSCFLLSLALFYLSTLDDAGGARAHPFGVANLFFTFYEFCGFNGLGLDRLSMRELYKSKGLASIYEMGDFLLLQAGLFGGYALLVVSYMRTDGKNMRPTIWKHALFLLMGISIVVFSLGYIKKFPVWGRHLSPTFPAFLLICAALMPINLKSSRWRQLAWALIFGFLICSSIRLRLLPTYAREDFRSAALYANSSLRSGRSVLWCAPKVCANYYGITTPSRECYEGVAMFFKQGVEVADDSVQPDVIITSTRQIMDMNCPRLSRLIASADYKPVARYKGITVYEK